jgi:hypothetical protein
MALKWPRLAQLCPSCAHAPLTKVNSMTTERLIRVAGITGGRAMTSASVASHRIVAPYITAWSGEPNEPVEVVGRAGGIGYRDEVMADRDRFGVLWSRTPWRPGEGRPEFGQVHPLRQRRTMLRLLCQVCAGPADLTDDGVLWLLKDHRDDWPGWPDRMGVTEPPICLSCVHESVTRCPALRKGAAVVRARHYPVAGVRGVLYRGSVRLVAAGEATVAYDDPAIRWVRAMNLVRQLSGCTIIPITDLAEE